MNAVPKFQKIVMALAAKHGTDLDRPGAYLRLEQEESGHLVIENIGGERISVTNYVQVGDSWMADPEIVVYVDRSSSTTATGEIEADWYPIEVNQFFGGWQLCAELDLHGALEIYDLEAQAELAKLADGTVASMLVIQEWLERGTPSVNGVPAWTPEEVRSRDIRMEEMDDVPF